MYNIIITLYPDTNIIKIKYENNKLILLVHKNKNKIYIQYYQCNRCNQSDVYILCHSIYKSIQKFYPELVVSNVRLCFYNLFDKSSKIIVDNRNMFLLLKWRVYTIKDNKKLSTRKYLKSNNNNMNIYLKIKYQHLTRNLKIFKSFQNNYKNIKYIFLTK